MQPSNIAQTLEAISAPRLASYRSMFKPASDHELYGVYCWNEAVSSGLGSIISTVEVTLRNAIHRELSRRYGPTTAATSYNWYDSLVLASGSAARIADIKGQQKWAYKTITPNDVIAGLTFGFWKHLLDVKVAKDGSPFAANHLLANVLPNHPNSDAAYWSQQKRQDAIYSRLDMIADIRNRVAHHEPVWKFGKLKEERRHRHNYVPKIVKMKPANPLEAIERLNLVFNRTFELLHWVSSYRALDYKASGNYYRARFLLSEDGLNAYRSLAPLKEVSLLGARRMMKTRTPFDGGVCLTHLGKRAAIVLPWKYF